MKDIIIENIILDTLDGTHWSPTANPQKSQFEKCWSQ